MPTRRSQLIVEGGDGKKKAVNCEYVVGTKLHFTIMTNAEKIMKLVPTMESHKSFNGLKSIQDSCQLVLGIISLGSMYRVIPNRMQYQPNDPAAKKPKSLEILPMEHMAVSPTGFYVFTVEGVGKVKTQLWLVAIVALAFFFLLFKVWPEWLKLGVWYLSWYTLVFLVSLLLPFSSSNLTINLRTIMISKSFYFCEIGCHCSRPCHCLVCDLPSRLRLLDLPQLLHRL